MGIPSYFSYIVKNHPEILQKYMSGSMLMHNLYMDCNSIIYDSFYGMTDEEKQGDIAKCLIQKVIVKIEEYISIVKPSDTVIIAFDGVAPVAKLDQQRTRRYKSWFQSKITNTLFDKTEAAWSTAAITPGTGFMKQLNADITTHFKNNEFVANIIVSATDDAGEGEHKIFQHIRDHPDTHADANTVIYGLDADLIMLSINHLPICSSLYLFRETPEFIKSISADLEPEENYLLDIPRLAKNIVTDMMGETPVSQALHNGRLRDYIFLCFFLGNDFLPHFPALNIRTGGIDKLLDHYRHTLGKTNKCIVDVPQDGSTEKIVWKNLRAVIASVTECEPDYIRSELALRDKREKRYAYQDCSTPEMKYDKFQSIPCYERTVEKHLNPDDNAFRHKYYTTLFHTEPDDARVQQICRNYLEGLEWTFRYYTTSCPDWGWAYKYQYPPLLQDLLRHIPYFDTQFISDNTTPPVSPQVQLCYVLPPRSLSLLPHKVYARLLKTCPEYYPDHCEFTWAFCRYFWEAHAALPEIDISVLERVVDGTI
jgi:5'-3' exonuclease